MGLGNSFGISSETNNNIQTDGLSAYWDAAYKKSYPRSGTAWTDIVGANNGTLTNGPTFNSDGGGSIVFDGSNDHTTIANLNPTDYKTAFTFSCWANFDDVSGDNASNAQILFGRHQGNERMYIGIAGANCKMGIGNAFQLNVVHGMSAEQWYNICITRSGTTNTYYVNLVSKTTMTSSWSGTSTTTVNIGCMNETGTPVQFTAGKIALVKLYTRALSIGEITQNYNAQKQRFGL